MANTLVDIGSFWLLMQMPAMPLLLANGLAYMLGAINSYLVNKHWTFGDRPRHLPIGAQILRFVAVNLSALAISSILILAFVHFVPAILAKVGSVAGMLCWNYWALGRFVYIQQPARPPPTSSG